MHASFTDAKNVFMVFDLAINGDLAAYLLRHGKNFVWVLTLADKLNFKSG